MFGLRLSAREQRTVSFGVMIVIAGLFITFGVLPFVRSWRAREAAIDAQTEQLARLRGLVAHESELRAAVEQRDATPISGQRLISGRTAALAAASLQSLLQNIADQSRLTVSRLDVAGAPENVDGSLPMIPATVSAIGDIYGLTEMLLAIQRGPHLLQISELNVRPNPALRGELLQLTIVLRAPYLGS